MTLLELCEPLFQYVCRLNRLARKGGRADPAQVAAEIRALMGDLRARAEKHPQLMPQVERIELPLIFFADFMVRESRLNYGSAWKGLAAERRELAGDEKFFELLDETIRESGEAANQRLAVFYTCLGLGFTGFYTGQPDWLRRKMLEISGRVRGMIEADQSARICAEAYEGVDTRVLTEPPGRSLVGIAVVLIGMTVVLFVANVVSYRAASAQLRRSLESIRSAEPGVGDRSASGGER